MMLAQGRLHATTHAVWRTSLRMASSATVCRGGQRVRLVAPAQSASPTSATPMAAAVCEMSALWLRDHCRCRACFHPASQQRLVSTHTLPLDLVVQDAQVIDDSRLRVTFPGPEPHVAEWDIAWLMDRRLANSAARVRQDQATRQLWEDGSTFLSQVPSVPFHELMTTDKTHRQWHQLMYKFGFTFVNGCPVTPEATEQLGLRVGRVIRDTHYGALWDFTPNQAHSDLAYTNLAITPHTDGTYWHDTPAIQMFHCLEFEGTGGESVLVDGFAAADKLNRLDPQAYKTLSTLEVPFQTFDEGVHLRKVAPTLSHDRNGYLEQIRFNNEDRAPLDTLSDADIDKFYATYQQLSTLIHRESAQFRFQLTPGSVLIFDNWRILHARSSFTGHRRIAGCYIGRDEYLSNGRTLGVRFS